MNKTLFGVVTLCAALMLGASAQAKDSRIRSPRRAMGRRR